MTALFNDTEKQINELFAHTLDKNSKSYNPSFRIDSNREQIELLTDRKFFGGNRGEMILLTDHLFFEDHGTHISFCRLFLECFEVCRCGKRDCKNDI